jgi:hypothetical protein
VRSAITKGLPIPIVREWRWHVTSDGVKLVGNISEISRGGLYSDRQERVTVSVEGAEPLYAELRLPNNQGWSLGQRVTVTIVPTAADQAWDVAA